MGNFFSTADINSLVEKPFNQLDKLLSKWYKDAVKDLKDLVVICAEIGVAFGFMRFLWCSVSNSKLYMQYKWSRIVKQKLIPPHVYPVYVPKSKTLEKLEKEIRRGLGVIVFWGPPDSGKSSYAIRSCNKMLEENKIGGLVQVHGSIFVNHSDNGASWLNDVIKGMPKLERNDTFSSLFPNKIDGASRLEKCLSK
jgi:AAA+ ATPase superfamily predicted ATPase